MSKSITEAEITYRNSRPLVRAVVEVPLSEWAEFKALAALTNALPAKVDSHVTSVASTTPA